MWDGWLPAEESYERRRKRPVSDESSRRASPQALRLKPKRPTHNRRRAVQAGGALAHFQRGRAVGAEQQLDLVGVVAETADLLYHLLVVLELREVTLADVEAALAQHMARSGLEEKASRPRD